MQYQKQRQVKQKEKMYYIKRMRKSTGKVNIWLLFVLMFFSITGCKKVTSVNKLTNEDYKVFEMVESNAEEEEEPPDVTDVDKPIAEDIVVVENENEPILPVTDPITDLATGVETHDTSTTRKTASSDAMNKHSANIPSTDTNVHVHNFVKHTETITHPEEGHYEIQTVQEAYDEGVYAWRTFCNKCGEDITDLGAEEITVHSAILCESGYHNDYVVVDTIHHEAVAEQVWVVDKEGYTETITTYKCDCGTTK